MSNLQSRLFGVCVLDWICVFTLWVSDNLYFRIMSKLMRITIILQPRIIYLSYFASRLANCHLFVFFSMHNA